MSEDRAVGCAMPTGGPVGETPPKGDRDENKPQEDKETRNMLLIGRKAPDFEAPAFHEGRFTSVKLSDYLGQWVLLCFYPGDYTFV
jgi:peroxiredoxin (alkyl hydroperoxide reductase subunit C)